MTNKIYRVVNEQGEYLFTVFDDNKPFWVVTPKCALGFSTPEGANNIIAKYNLDATALECKKPLNPVQMLKDKKSEVRKQIDDLEAQLAELIAGC